MVLFHPHLNSVYRPQQSMTVSNSIKKVCLFLDCIPVIFQYLLGQTVKHLNTRFWKRTVQEVFTECVHNSTDNLIFQMLFVLHIRF